MDKKNMLSLRLVILRLLGVHLFVPLAVLCLLTVVGVAYLGEQNLKSQQHQVVDSMVKSVNDHLDNGGRILEAVARVAEISNKDELSNYMKSTWEAYGYFDTIYYLDPNNISRISFPYDLRYLGLDMSNIPDFKNADGQNGIVISSPFISLRTGQPTVYLIRPLSDGGRIVGELSLGLFQKDITNIMNNIRNNSVFIVDKNGNLIAHPSVDMVKQQVNMNDLYILKLDLSTIKSSTYYDNGKSVIGSAEKIEKIGWVVIDQTDMIEFWSSYALVLLLVFLGAILIFFALSWNLRKQLRRYVSTPLEDLGIIVNELADGNYSKIDYLSSINSSFSELDKFASDFQIMSKNLQIREASLKESEDRYRGLFNRVPIGLFRASLDGSLLDVNPAAVRIFGYPNKEKLLEIKISDMVYSPLNTDEHSRAEFEMTLSNFESQMYNYLGNVIWIRVTAQLVEDEKNKHSYYEGSIENITKRKNAEKALKHAKDELEQQVEIRTQQLVDLNKELQQLSSLDGLTGINNRRYFDQFLEAEWQRSIRQETPLSLIILDLDFFKDYNDLYGHQAGDDCLKRVASAFKSVLKRSSDLAARYGGEEFVAVLCDTDATGASVLAEEMRETIEKLKIKHERSSISQYVTVSIGVASVMPLKNTSQSEIVSIADQALYNAKREGRNRVSFGRNV